MKSWIKSGAPWIWLNAGAVALSLVMVVGLLLLIAVRGLSHFWPTAVLEATFVAEDGAERRLIGELANSETLPAAAMRDAGYEVDEDQLLVSRHLLKLGNRDLTGRDFLWYLEDEMGQWSYPREILVLERTEWGNLYGYLREVRQGEQVVAVGDPEATWQALAPRVERANDIRRQIQQIERYDIGAINFRLEQQRLERRRMQLRGADDPASLAAIAATEAQLNAEYEELAVDLRELQTQLARDSVVVETMDGQEVTVSLGTIVWAYRPNAMGFGEKLVHYWHKFREFVGGYPREANTEGGIFPAIFGTVMMVILMSIVVTPFGVLAAIYLREYAKQGPLVRTIRISVNNLAGVPSIVFGVFGLGFFVYFVGGGLDRLLFPEALPAPTFGTPGLMWASLTLALLTLPVVIVATEEGLTRIPRAVREGSLALGATKAETIWKIVVPIAAPAMMTGLILAVARAAGEVAPLMLVGVVKLAPNLPVDGNFPFVHLERKFMHLGFHIYDVGFQSPNVEAARPLVYATAFTLVVLIVILNLTAISIRNYLREKYKSDSD